MCRTTLFGVDLYHERSAELFSGSSALLERVVRRFPERTALCGPEVAISYAELWRVLTGWAERIAAATAPGDLVGILVPVSPEFPIAMLACGVVQYLPEDELARARDWHSGARPGWMRPSPYLASAAYRPGTYKGQLTVFEPDRRDLGVPSSALLWSRHASALRHEKPQTRHDDMLEGANAQAVANLLPR